MTDEVQAADEAAPEVVQTEAEQVAAPEAVESTEGQVETPPAESDAEGEADADQEEKISASRARRERRKAEMKRVKEEAAQVEAENAKLLQELETLKGAEKTPPPKLEDFDDHDEYLASLSAHKAMESMDNRRVSELEREAAERKAQRESLQQKQMAEAQQNWAAQVDEAKTRYADFDAVVAAPDVAISQDMAAVLAMSDAGADMAYHLGTNKAQALQLAQMPKAQMIGAMQMLEQFVSSNAPRPRTQTNAPQPVNPVKGNASGIKSVKDMSQAEYEAARAQGKI